MYDFKTLLLISMPPYNLFWHAYNSLHASREIQMLTNSCQSCGCSLLPDDFSGISVLRCCRVSFSEYLYPQENNSKGKMICQALCVILVDEVVSLKNLSSIQVCRSCFYTSSCFERHPHTPPLVQSGIWVLQLNGNVFLLPCVCKGPVNLFYARDFCVLL